MNVVRTIGNLPTNAGDKPQQDAKIETAVVNVKPRG
jgi:hypothetical protein